MLYKAEEFEVVKDCPNLFYNFSYKNSEIDTRTLAEIVKV